MSRGEHRIIHPLRQESRKRRCDVDRERAELHASSQHVVDVLGARGLRARGAGKTDAERELPHVLYVSVWDGREDCGRWWVVAVCVGEGECQGVVLVEERGGFVVQLVGDAE